MQTHYQQSWPFGLSGERQYAPQIKANTGALGRTLRRLGGQTIVLALVLLDIGGLGHALVASVWIAPWVAINVTALVLGSLSLSEDRRIQRESATAIRRQGERVRTAGWRKFKQLQRKAQTEQQDAERRQREQREQREAEERLQAALRKAQEQLRETEQRQYHEQKERESQRKRSEQAERLRQSEQHRREAERRR